MTTRLILIRHGSTEWNTKQIYCGFVDLPLNAKGKAQAKRLYTRLRTTPVDIIYCSDRKRAIETAGIVFRGRDVEIIPELREIHFGIFEGLTYKQIIKKYPTVFSKWIKNPFKTVIPKGESLSILKKRVLKALKRIISRHTGQTVAIVCHGGTISAFINHVLKSKDFWKYIPKSASMTVLEIKNKGIKIKLLSDVSHLGGIKIDAVKFKD